jgi:hypothetical protein
VSGLLNGQVFNETSLQEVDTMGVVDQVYCVLYLRSLTQEVGCGRDGTGLITGCANTIR